MTGYRWRMPLGCALVLFTAAAALEAAEHPTIHHAGTLISVDLASGALVLDERERLGPPLLTRIVVAGEAVIIRVIRVGAEFRGQEVPLSQLRPGEYLAVRGVDLGDRHLAQMIWSLGPAQ